MVSIGFTRKENDWKVWKPILSEEELKDKKNECRYSLNPFEVFYMPDTLEYIRLSFYEHDQRQFTEDGKSKYYELKSAFLVVGSRMIANGTNKEMRV